MNVFFKKVLEDIKKKVRMSPMFSFKDIAKVPKEDPNKGCEPSRNSILLGQRLKMAFLGKYEERKIINEHSRSSSHLSQASDRAHDTVQKIYDKIDACCTVQGWFFTARRNIQKQVEDNAREENSFEMEIEHLNLEEKKEEYFSGKNTL